MLFGAGFYAGLWQPVRSTQAAADPLASEGDTCAQEQSCFPRCQCEHKVCRITCFDKHKDADGKVNPKKWEPCIDACVATYKVCLKRC
jgi:hypothetical protein